jgi:hypothetical protein
MAVRASKTATTAITTSNTTIKSSSGRVFWAAISETGGSAQEVIILTDGSGTRWRGDSAPDSVSFHRFNPPLEMVGSIGITHTGAGVATVTTGYE